MASIFGRAAVALAILVAGGGAALACPDLADAPSSRWTLARDGGADWLVTPCGERFYSLGVNVLNGEIPAEPVLGRVRYDWRRSYPSLDAWVAETRHRLAAWGFNSAGAWSLPPSRLRLPSIPNLEIGRLAKFHWFDPFDPATEARMRAIAPALVAPYKGSPYRIGYFTDNEVGWWGGALFLFYETKPASNYTKQRWVEMLRAWYHDDFQRFAADFVPPARVGSWDDLLASREVTRLRPGGEGIAVVRRWTGILAEHYYAMAERVLRAADPDALIFGDRLPIYYDPVAVRAMARHVDAIAVNYNIDSPDGWVARYFFDGLRQLTGGKPVLVSEWFFAAAENRTGNSNNGHLMTVASQAERARGAAAAELALAAIPETVGAHWFQWADHPAGGRADGEDYDFGLVDINDRPYRRLTDALAAANREVRAVHEVAKPNAPPKSHDFTIPEARVSLAAGSLAPWPKPAALVPPLTPEAGEVAFGEAYLAWSEEGLSLGTVGQDYYDPELLAYNGEFPLGESYRIAIGLDAGMGPRRFTLYIVPPPGGSGEDAPTAALLCAGAATAASRCREVAGGQVRYFGDGQPRVTAGAFLPWSALGLEHPPASRRIKVEIAGTAWDRSHWMSLSGLPPAEGLSDPARWAIARLGPAAPAAPPQGRPGL